MLIINITWYVLSYASPDMNWTVILQLSDFFNHQLNDVMWMHNMTSFGIELYMLSTTTKKFIAILWLQGSVYALCNC